MKQDKTKSYIYQYYHEFSNDFAEDGVWVTEKTVSPNEEALIWVKGLPKD